MKLVKVLSALAVIAVSMRVEAADDSGGEALNTKKITVKFVVCNGG